MKDHTNIMFRTAAFLVNRKLRWRRWKCDVIKSAIMTSLKELRHIEIELTRLLNFTRRNISSHYLRKVHKHKGWLFIMLIFFKSLMNAIARANLHFKVGFFFLTGSPRLCFYSILYSCRVGLPLAKCFNVQIDVKSYFSDCILKFVFLIAWNSLTLLENDNKPVCTDCTYWISSYGHRLIFGLLFFAQHGTIKS